MPSKRLASRTAEAMSGANWRAAVTDLKLEISEVKGTLKFHSWVLLLIAAGVVGQFIQGFFQP